MSTGLSATYASPTSDYYQGYFAPSNWETLYNNTNQGYTNEYNTVMGTLSGVGNQLRQNVINQDTAAQNTAIQGLVNNGLGATTMLPTVRLGYAKQQQADLATLNEQLLQQQAADQMNILGAQNTYQAQAQQAYANLGLQYNQYGLQAAMLPYSEAQSSAQTGLLGAQTNQITSLLPYQENQMTAQTGLLGAQTNQINQLLPSQVGLANAQINSLNRMNTLNQPSSTYGQPLQSAVDTSSQYWGPGSYVPANYAFTPDNGAYSDLFSGGYSDMFGS